MRRILIIFLLLRLCSVYGQETNENYLITSNDLSGVTYRRIYSSPFIFSEQTEVLERNPGILEKTENTNVPSFLVIVTKKDFLSFDNVEQYIKYKPKNYIGSCVVTNVNVVTKLFRATGTNSISEAAVSLSGSLCYLFFYDKNKELVRDVDVQPTGVMIISQNYWLDNGEYIILRQYQGTNEEFKKLLITTLNTYMPDYLESYKKSWVNL